MVCFVLDMSWILLAVVGVCWFLLIFVGSGGLSAV